MIQIWAQLLTQLQGRRAAAVAHLQMTAETFGSFESVREYMCVRVSGAERRDRSLLLCGSSLAPVQARDFSRL